MMLTFLAKSENIKEEKTHASVSLFIHKVIIDIQCFISIICNMMDNKIYLFPS